MKAARGEENILSLSQDPTRRRARPAIALLVRHAHTDAIGARLVGRMPGVPLSPVGLCEAERLATRLQDAELAAVYSSPLERAATTASYLARGAGLTVQLSDGLTEIDFGEWTGRTFDELERDAAWHRFNACRGSAQVPGGESALHVQARIVAVLDAMRTRHPGAVIALVTHADVIRAAVLHCAGAPLDLFHRFEISPASVTAIELGEGSPRLLYVNERDAAAQGRALGDDRSVRTSEHRSAEEVAVRTAAPGSGLCKVSR